MKTLRAKTAARYGRVMVLAGALLAPALAQAQTGLLGGLLSSPIETVVELGTGLLSPLSGGAGGDALALGDLPLLDGRGLPVVGGLDGGLQLVQGLVRVALDNPNFSGDQPLGNLTELQLVDMLVNGGPTLNFLALDEVLLAL